MIYVVLRGTESEQVRIACIVKAESIDRAKEIVGLDEESKDWSSFTEDEVKTIANTKEGYVSADM